MEIARNKHNDTVKGEGDGSSFIIIIVIGAFLVYFRESSRLDWPGLMIDDDAMHVYNSYCISELGRKLVFEFLLSRVRRC